ncbi:hypothetical protein SAMN04490188_4012 [Pseudomonas kilonensis]|uniref:Transposase n=1 Tax=Pseudomonas kilonensis TaxID=132476 RepID=A0ABY0ZAE0_9PSED|nr:hypothetical protein SAMN04490188_4012 [Pseudomonas kilonensis]
MPDRPVPDRLQLRRREILVHGLEFLQTGNVRFSRSSHSSRLGSRARMPLMLKVTIRRFFMRQNSKCQVTVVTDNRT